MNNFNNERIHFFIKIYLSHFILERVMFVVCDINEWRQGQTAILTQQYFFLILAGLLNCGSLRAQSPQSANWSSRRHPVSNWLKPSGHLLILLSNNHLLLLFFRLFTQVHLLIYGSVEGQYMTFQKVRAFFHMAN